MTKNIEIKISMEGMPDAADAAQVAAEVQLMIQKEYADGVKVFAASTSTEKTAMRVTSVLVPKEEAEELEDDSSK